MKSVLLVAGLLFAPQDVEEDGVKLYQQGRHSTAAEVFRRALEENPDDGELSYNLALALWRLGESDAAETAAERAAAMGGYAGLRDGILGNLRYDQARETSAGAAQSGDEIGALERAIASIRTASDHYQRGVFELETRDPESAAALLRNFERGLSLEDELVRRLEDAREQQRQEQSQREQEQGAADEQDQTADQQGQEENKGDEEEKTEEQKAEEQRAEEEKTEEQKAEEQRAEEEKTEEQKAEEGKTEEQEQEEQRRDEQRREDEQQSADQGDESRPGALDQAAPVAPGEHDPNSMLSPEQKRQILEMLARLEEQLEALRSAQRVDRPKVKKDW